jgi:XrtJ-associated TM-motif-TM protein
LWGTAGSPTSGCKNAGYLLVEDRRIRYYESTDITNLIDGDSAMNKTRIAALAAFAMFFAAASLHAQSGCSDSPENPTALLGLIGAGGFVVASSRRKLGGLLQKTLKKRK